MIQALAVLNIFLKTANFGTFHHNIYFELSILPIFYTLQWPIFLEMPIKFPVIESTI